MRLGELVAGLPVPGGPTADGEVAGIEHDSRRVRPGDLFVAIPGRRHDGRAFVGEAVERGAVAVLGRGPRLGSVSVPWLSAENPRRLLGVLAARLWRRPDLELTLVGVTGTNGKSTVAWVAASVLTAAGNPAGRIGSLAHTFAGISVEARHTTPEASELFRILRQMRDEGAAAATMEVSSHALVMGRVDEVHFDVAVFTNLSRDHLDFHDDMEDYYQAKRGLFVGLKTGGRGVVCTDDEWGRRLAEEIPGTLTYGREGEIRPLAREVHLGGVDVVVETPRGELALTSSLRGSYNVTNLVAVVAVAEALDLPHEAVRRGIADVDPIPGRMEPVEAGQEFPIFVDYAHTPEALRAAITAVKEVTGRKVIVVFGCGGDRDRAKRPLMGRVAGELAELPIVTSDNPRSEDPLAIISEVESGLRDSGNEEFRVMPDRADAIRRAVSVAGPEWAVLVAGKGHETTQIIGDEIWPFSDREHLEGAVEERLGATDDG